MKVPVGWLKSLVDFEIGVEELAKALTMAGLEVEGIDVVEPEIKNVVVGEILGIRPHRNADNLLIGQVSDGKQIYQVVCGAKNIKKGDKVPFARIGAELPGGEKIQKAKIHDENSFGMLCSGKELRINEDHSGILILPQNSSLGVEVAKGLGLEDLVLNIELTANRSDCASIKGVAREVSALLGSRLKEDKVELEETGDNIESRVKVTVNNTKDCTRYACRLIEGVKVGESPRWLVKNLELAGMRSINNIVDITNYVLMELGHPLHTFDFDRLNNRELIIRSAKQDESILTLDGEEKRLGGDNLVIADGKEPQAIAGIIGGEKSGVTNETQNIVLESAYFNPSSIRKTARELNLTTESSYRFERGIDWENVRCALDRVASLIVKIAGGRVAKGVIDIYSEPHKARSIELKLDEVNNLLGIELDGESVKDILSRLGFSMSNQISERSFVFDVPSYRNDVSISVDLIEEISRIFGYNKIPETFPYVKLSERREDDMLSFERAVNGILEKLGLVEVIINSLLAENFAQQLGIERVSSKVAPVKISNPLTTHQSVLRTSLLPGLLFSARHNFNQKVTRLEAFEIGRVFQQPQKQDSMPQEKRRLGGVLYGRQDDGASWTKKSGCIDFYYVKGLLSALFKELGLDVGFRDEKLSYAPARHPLLHSGRNEMISYNKRVLGIMGEISLEIAEKLDLPKGLYLFEMDLATLKGFARLVRPYKSISRFPKVERDIALLVPVSLTHDNIFSRINKSGGKLLSNIKLFDIYKGAQVKEGYKSLAFRLTFSSEVRTLTDDEVRELYEKICHTVEVELGAEIRR